MNIFYVDSNPQKAAQSLVDKHVVKMILESAQLLCTTHRILDGINKVLNDDRESILYKATHQNHPSAVWVRKSISNYKWLYEHFLSLMQEYSFRYNKNHKCEFLIDILRNPPYNIANLDFQPPPPAMPPEFITSSAIESYRKYYKIAKAALHKWTKRNPPSWINL